jgi:glyoxylase-like metal-dependent hydrolase (beta-lactamase superfamily II)
MSIEGSWFEVIKHKNYLYVIRERLDKLEPRFYTTYVNLYLLIGKEKALLIDTGTGLFSLKPLVQRLIGHKELIVLNTHSDFDHRGSNEEFNLVYIHSSEVNELSKPFDLSFLKDLPQDFAKNYMQKDFILKPVKSVKGIEDGFVFNLGNISIKVIHTPGHSPGSISLLSSKKELFTGDTAHYGTIYLPKREEHSIILSSLQRMLRICLDNGVSELYPSHEAFPVGLELLYSLINGISKFDIIWQTKIWDNFLEGWVLNDDNFKYVVE